MPQITSEPDELTPAPVIQSVVDNTEKDLGLVVLPDLAGGDTSLHIPTPNLISATPTSDAAQVNVGLGKEIGNPDGSDD